MPPISFKAETKVTLRRCGDGRLDIYKSAWGELPVLHIAGDARELGRQYGALVGDKIRRIADRLVGLFTAAGLPEAVALLFIDSAWKRLAPHVPAQFLEEMSGVEVGAREAGFPVTLVDMQRILAMTNLDMYKREERFLDVVGMEALAELDEETRAALAAMLQGEAMSCTMFAVWGSRTVDGKCFAIRNLDWISQSGMHEERLVTVCRPEGRQAFVSMGYAGVIGCLAGMNEKGISLSEVGAFSVREELDGIPWVLMARQVLENAACLEDAVGIIKQTTHTLGYNYLVADGDPARFGTPQFKPRAAAFETNAACCEVFYEDDPQEHAATWTSPQGETFRYGAPLREAIMRADTAFGAASRSLQAADDGPGDPDNTGNPWGRDNAGSTYTTCHLPMHDMIRAYETGAEYVFPVRNTKVIEKGAPRKIGPEEMLNIAATVAHNTEMLHENDWNVMSIAYAPTDLNFWVGYESRNPAGEWRNAPDSGYWEFSLKELLA